MKFTISVITFSALEHAKRCISSVLANRAGARLILTAQGNPVAADWFHCVARDNPDVTVIVSDTNEGFIIPTRKAFTLVETPLVVFLNDDCLVESPGWLEALEKPFNDVPTCAMSGPVGGRYRASRNPNRNAIEYIFGWCMMGRTDILKQVGLFSDYLTGSYWEECDLQMRLMAIGYTLHVAPDCKVTHAGKTTSRHVPGIAAIERRNFREVSRRFPQYFGKH